MDRFPSESREKNSKRQGFRAEEQRRGILEPRDGRTPALADKIWCMLLEARVAQPVTETEAVRLARELYGLEASARALPGADAPGATRVSIAVASRHTESRR